MNAINLFLPWTEINIMQYQISKGVKVHTDNHNFVLNGSANYSVWQVC